MARTKGKGKAVDAGISPVKKTKRVVQNVGVSSSGPPTKKRKEGETSGVKNVEDGSKSPKGKKLKRKEFAIPNDVKCRRRIKNTEDGPDAKKKTDHPKLKTRTTTSTFFKKLTVLNDAQKDAVRSIGFGHILEFKVNRVPSKLAYWVLDKFNHRSCTLELDVLTKVEIEEDDVYRVYGFPKGNKLIENFERTTENELFIEWMNFFNVANRDKIKIKAVLRRMVDSADGGTWFKRHFVIALCFSLMESCTSGTVHSYIFRALANIEEIKSWNWGEYLLRCLIDHKKSWMTDKTKVFGGPTLFLVLFYVDRIQIGRQSVPRGFPIFMQWTGKTLREREDKELDDDFFGGGAVVKPIALPIEYTTDVPTEYGQGGEYRGPVATKLMNDAIVIGEMIRVAREMVQKASAEEKKSQYFKDSLVAASKIIGVTIEVGGKVRDKLPEGLEPETDPFWYTDEVHDAVDAASVETLGNKTRDMPENVDIPSFSLNVTQEFENAPSNVDDIGGIGAENHEGIGSIVDVAATAEVTEDVTEQNEGPNPRGSGTGIQNDGVMGINITTDKDVVVDGSVNVGHGGMEASLLDAVDGSVNVEQEDIACDIAVAKKLKSAAADDCGLAKDDENLIAANKENAKDQDKDVSDVVVEKIEVRRSNRVKGNFGRDAKKKLMNATTTKSGVKVAYPKKK